MEKYIGIGFVILCLAILAGVVGILGYQMNISKEKVDISPATANINQSNKTTDE
jgi:Na+-transporting methylmalonyl-CoA/oxaloacetate decarboxylase gamma subunit